MTAPQQQTIDAVARLTVSGIPLALHELEKRLERAATAGTLTEEKLAALLERLTQARTLIDQKLA